MSAVGGTVAMLQSWGEAWRGRADNPLAAWAVVESRRLRALPWRRRSPGLAVLASLLALAAAGANGWLLYDLLRLPEVTPRHALAYVSGGLVQLLRAATLFAVFWYLARIYTVMQFAFSFLSSAPRRTVALAVDDMLAVTTVTDAELLWGGVRYGLARLMPPVAALAAVASFFAAKTEWKALVEEQWRALTPLEGWTLWAQAALMFVMVYSFALATAAALILTGIALSRGRQPLVLASIAAAVMVLAQLVAFPMSAGYVASLYGDVDNFVPLGTLAEYTWTALLLLVMLLWVAESKGWFRTALLVTLPVSWVLIQRFFGGAMSQLLGGPSFGSDEVLLTAGLICPLNASVMTLYASWPHDYECVPVWYLWTLWAVMLGYQCCFVALAEAFALRSVRLRRRGAE